MLTPVRNLLLVKEIVPPAQAGGLLPPDETGKMPDPIVKVEVVQRGPLCREATSTLPGKVIYIHRYAKGIIQTVINNEILWIISEDEISGIDQEPAPMPN